MGFIEVWSFDKEGGVIHEGNCKFVFVPWQIENVSVIKKVDNHRHRVSLTNAILQRDRIREVVIKPKLRAPARERHTDCIDKRLRNPAFPHVVKQPIFHRIWKSALDVKK